MPSMHLSLTKCFLALFKTFFYLPFNYVGSQSQTLPIILPFTWCFDWSVLNFPYIRSFMCVKSTNFTKINHSAFFTSRKFWPEIFISKSKRTCLPNRQKKSHSIYLSTSDVSLYIILYHRKFHYYVLTFLCPFTFSSCSDLFSNLHLK